MNGLFPPILPSSRSAHLIDDISSYTISYTLPYYLDFSEVEHAQVLITYQSNNDSVVDTSIHPDGIIYTTNFDNSSVTIEASDLASDGWISGIIYKIQVRFGSTALWGDMSNFATWKSDQILNDTFSEWSNVMISKPIEEPEINFLNVSPETTTRPQFQVEYFSEEEQISFSRFVLYYNNSLLEDSGNLIFTQNADAIGQYTQNKRANYLTYQFKHMLQNGYVYTAGVEITTVNGYKTEMETFTFLVQQNQISPISGLSISAEDTVFGRENGCIQLYLTCGSPLTGDFIVSRTSEKSSFNDYEDIKKLTFSNITVNNTLIMNDYTIESDIKYRYAIQYQNNSMIRSTPILSNIAITSFEYSYFYRAGVQLKLKFNNRITSFKHTVLRSKQDTLGSRYPYLAQNGNAYYAEFPISGLISFHSDSDEQDWTFFNTRPSGVYYKDELVIPRDRFEARQASRPQVPRSSATIIDPNDYVYFDHWKSYPNAELDNISGEYENNYYPNNQDIDRFEDNYYERNPGQVRHTRDPIILPSGEYAIGAVDYTITTDLTQNNFYIERKFREKVEEFLNDFNYKLFKSPSEGNMVVALMNVQLTPKEELGRMVYEFSATAYEVLGHEFQDLVNCGIEEIDEEAS